MQLLLDVLAIGFGLSVAFAVAVICDHLFHPRTSKWRRR